MGGSPKDAGWWEGQKKEKPWAVCDGIKGKRGAWSGGHRNKNPTNPS